MKTILCTLGIICLTCSAWPCINKTGTKYGGGTGSYFGWRSLEVSLKKSLKSDGAEMEASLRGSTNFTDRSDYAVALMFLGRSAEAVSLLNQLEREQPGQYFIAANLGTAYELSGNNQEALRWINEGIRRNPDSHEGTEWLHVKILEAKIAQEKDPAYFEKHSVLELQPGTIGEQVAVGQKNFQPIALASAIEHQLGERLQFVKPPDAAVASLLFDYAAIEAATHSMESATHILKMATDYGYPAIKVAALRKEFDRRLGWERFKTYAFYGLIGVVGVALLVWLYKRGIFVLSSRDLKRR